MKLLSLSGVLLFMLTSAVVGTRLLVLWWRTRKLPELLLALAVLCVGFLCFAVGTAAKLLIVGTPALRSTLTGLGLSVEACGQLLLVVFSWRVFHPKSRLALGFAALLISFILVALAGELWSGEFLRYSDSERIAGPFVPLGNVARGMAPAWMAFECFRFHNKLRLRARIGLAEPLVVHRVALWGIGMGASSLGYASAVAHRLVFGTGLREHVWALTTVSLLGMISAVSIAMAFFPPARYRRWVESQTRR